MKRIALLLTAIALTCASANAQSLLERLGQRAKNAAENNVGNKVEQGVNDLLNGKLGKKKDKKDQKQETAQPAQTAVTDGTWTCPNPECGHTGNTGNFCTECGTKKPAGEAAAQSAPQNKQVQTAYAKTDFVPGDVVIFDDPMDGEQLGEFPSMWDLLDGEAEVLEIDGKKCFALNKHGDSVAPLMKEARNFLGDVFTVEFDILKEDKEFRGGHSLILDFYPADATRDASFSLETRYSSYSKDTGLKWEWRTQDGKRSGEKETVAYPLGVWNHVSISFNKRALKWYLNGERQANVPNVAVVPGWFRVGLDGSGTTYLTNFRICQGAVPLYDRLASDGKIVTYAITFDTGKATLKPEADVEINRIKGIMDKDPSLKFEVQGHCDNTGSDAVNDPLSQKRAEAIVARLMELGISADRLTAVGKGSHEPIADNATDEGRAKNRRVEFVKK